MRPAELLSTRQVCALLGVRETIIQDAVRRGFCPAPPMVGRSRAWTPELVEQLRAALAAREERLAAQSWTTQVDC